MKFKIKKLLYIVLCACFLLNIESMFVYAANDTVPQRVAEIASGSNNIYGVGIPIEHIANPNQRFVSGGLDHTHQYIVAQALMVLNNDCGASIFNQSDHAETLLYNADWPDTFGNETDAGTFSGHFYDPDTGKNWMGQSSPTARTRAEYYYRQALHDYNLGDSQSAMVYLGRGAHYVADLNEPHHASNLTALNSNHTEFETYVDKNRKSYYIVNQSLPSEKYEEALNSSVGDLLYYAAKSAKALAGKAQVVSQYDEAASKSVTGAITSISQYYYKFGKTVGIYE